MEFPLSKDPDNSGRSGRSGLLACMLTAAIMSVTWTTQVQSNPSPRAATNTLNAPIVGPATCPAERAVYELRVSDSEDVWRIELVPAQNTRSIASDLYLKLVTPVRTYWF